MKTNICYGLHKVSQQWAGLWTVFKCSVVPYLVLLSRTGPAGWSGQTPEPCETAVREQEMWCYVSATFSDVGAAGRARVKQAHRCGEKFDVWLQNAPLLPKNTHRKAAERKLLVALPKCKFIGYEEVERVAIGLVKTKTNTKVPPAAWETTWESKAQSTMLRLPLSPRESYLWLDRG